MKLIPSNTETLLQKKLYIFDMDGTIYLGNRVFPFAVDFINRLRVNGRRILFFTNNASHTSDFYYAKLERLGFSPREGEIMTAGDVTAEFLLRHRNGKKVYLVGTEELAENYRARGIELASESDKNCDIVVTSFDTGLTYEKMNTACRFVREGAEYLSTHPDFNCPTEDGFIPDSGAIAAFVTASTGVMPHYLGKPYRETVEMIMETSGLKASELCVFGDRLYTDIALGKRHGVTSVLVLTGETTREDVENVEEADRPDYVFPSLAEVDELLIKEENSHGI